MDYTADKFDVFEKTPANYVPLSPLSFLPRAALMHGDRKSIIYGDREYTWADTYRRCRQMASALTQRGIGKNDTVAIVAANTPEMVEALWGVPMAGAVLNTINTRLDADTIAYILNHGEARVLIIDAELSPDAARALELIGRDDILVIDILDLQNSDTPRRVGSTDYETFIASGDPAFEWSLPDDEWDAIALNYTSGTSGRPKGVVYHHRGSYLMSMGTISDWSLPQNPKYVYVVPLFHCNGWGHGWTMAALAGTIVCTRVVSAKVIYDALADHDVRYFGGAPIVLSMILNATDEERRELPHTVEVMTAGAPPPAAVLQGIEELGFNVSHVYGLTETYGHTVMCNWNDNWDDLAFDQKAEIKSRQGAAMVMMEGQRIVSDGDIDNAPDGEHMGELILRGNTVMKGYLKNPDATREAFADGWFRTGDLAVMHDRGYAQIKDRLKDIIISGGENISSVEVEGALHRHPAVSLAAVVAKPDDKWGEVPCAFIELKDGASATADEIIAFCREHLAGYKRPKHVVFCTLPKTATGKIQKYELRKMIPE
ncbi:acyl-CoA synthetase [Amylibacter kogurei]|uniref:3-methylmercaptopropionyl-CoA ligase n=1 Tax=Paramylibacter kogurei TaxID=1889778 RepID=A0A2G5K361_9RHOB|nr:acyl-CoA synthetase [Amylibacter kogurei]PIB23443.1 acyl-CoA synthetase [Amylibacter kogurei]